MSRLGYYPGCSLQSTAAEYDRSLKAVFAALAQELTELPDWNCCGATAGHSTSAYLAAGLLLRNLALAEKNGIGKLAVPCAACYNLLKTADLNIREAAEETMQVNAEMQQLSGYSYSGTVQVMHPLQMLSQPASLARIEELVVRPLSGLKVAAYYGCLLTRPASIAFDDIHEPVSMDRILASLGAEVRKWSYKTDCCGASLSLPRPETVEKLVTHLAAMASRAGADALAVACPLCQANFDTRQSAVRGRRLPAFYFTELMGIAFGHPEARQWLAKHIIDPRPLLTTLQLL
jgi:heterodisulfide reductase subunit B